LKEFIESTAIYRIGIVKILDRIKEEKGESGPKMVRSAKL
jgi:hypothetical protein